MRFAPCNGSVTSSDPANPEQPHAVASLWRRKPVGAAEVSQLQAASPGEGVAVSEKAVCKTRAECIPHKNGQTECAGRKPGGVRD